MRRIIAAGGTIATVLGLAAAPAAAATAAFAPVAGTITCGLTGTMTFSKPLPNANLDPTTKNTHISVKADLTDCVSSGVTGGKAPITGGKLIISGFLEPGASCADLSGAFPPDFTSDPNVLNVKWNGTTAKGGTTNVGRSKTDIFSTGDTLLGGWEYVSDSFGPTDAFANESATLDFILDSTKQVNDCVAGRNDPTTGQPVNLHSVSFSAANGSQIAVTP